MSAAWRRPWFRAGALAALVVALDQAAKAVVEDRIVLGQEVDVLGPLQLTNAHNTGVAFGLAGGGGAGIVVITVAALALVLFLFARNPSRRGIWVATGLIAGGAVGNLIDRVRMGAVTDFIDLPAWPPFNIADMAITFGVILLAWIFLWEET